MPSGKKIKEFRLKRNLTQKELAAKCGMYESQIRKYELGTANPKLETLKKIADALEINVNQLEWTISDQLTAITEMERMNRGKGYSVLDSFGFNFETQYRRGRISEEEYQRQKKDFVQKETLLNAFNSLNVEGKEKAIEQTKILAKVPEYQKQYPQYIDSVPKKTDSNKSKEIDTSDNNNLND